MTAHRVTVCVPTYNKAPLLETSLRSILAQTFSDFKLIVIDDQSADATREVVAALNDSRIRYVRNASNLGLTANWNRSLDLALDEPGPYIAIYHDDDYYAPTMLEREVDFLEKHSRAGFVHTAQFYYNEVERRYSLRQPYPYDRMLNALELLDDLYRKGIYHIATPSVLARKDAYSKAGRFDLVFKICPDLDLWWRMLDQYEMGYIAEPLFIQRIHRRQVSSSSQAFANAMTQNEPMMVLEGALQRLSKKHADLNFDKYRAAARHYCAKQILFVAKDALLTANTIVLRDACSGALRLSSARDIYISTLLLRSLNNSLGRRVMSVAIKMSRAFRESSQPSPSLMS